MSPSASARRALLAATTANSTGISGSRLRLFGVAVICAKVALIPVIFDSASDFPFGPSKVLLSHALSYVVAGVIAGLAVRFGRSLWVWSPVHVPVLIFLGLNALATIFA